MANSLKPPISSIHFALFGQIVSAYAMNEQLLKAALAIAIEVDMRVVTALTSRMNATELRKKMSALANDLVPEPDRSRLLAFTQRLGVAGELRNKIAHPTWAPGASEGTMRASEVKVRHSGIVVAGFDDDEPEYSIADLDACAEEMYLLSRDVLEYLRSKGVAGS